jgi:hypothetical protein
MTPHSQNLPNIFPRSHGAWQNSVGSVLIKLYVELNSHSVNNLGRNFQQAYVCLFENEKCSKANPETDLTTKLPLHTYVQIKKIAGLKNCLSLLSLGLRHTNGFFMLLNWPLQKRKRGAQCTSLLCFHSTSFIHSFIEWFYSNLLGPGLFFSFVIFFYTDGRAPWTRDQPAARPLPKHRTTQTE